MAFEGLTEKLQGALRKLSSKGKLTEENVKEGMREVRMARLKRTSTTPSPRTSQEGHGALRRHGNHRHAERLPAGHQNRQRGNDPADGRRKRPPDMVVRPADGLHALRPAGCGQNHHGSQS